MANNSKVLDWIEDCATQLSCTEPMTKSGKLTKVSGLVVQAVGLDCGVGTLCEILTSTGGVIEAEVVGFGENTTYLMPLSDVSGLKPGQVIYPQPNEWVIPQIGKKTPEFRSEESHTKHLPVGDGLLGRIVDANAKVLDNKGPLDFKQKSSMVGPSINPIDRTPVREPIDVGVKAINALLTVGKGQRLGLFAGSGVGKSVLLGMMAKYTSASRVVVGLIGERGREVKEFIEDILGEEGLARAVVVAAPADCSPLLRLQGAAYASTLAEHFREEGHDVLLLMDSLTRYAQAQREIALAVGEPPATKGYPPSVFAKLPMLVERAGNGGSRGGSITAFYTVLSEGDDQQDPIADSARAILDGHFVLSRRLAEQGHYPAIDIEQSISRVMFNVVSPEHMKLARNIKLLYSKFNQSRDLVSIGAYASGSDPETDMAIALQPKIREFLTQDMGESFNMDDTLALAKSIFG